MKNEVMNREAIDWLGYEPWVILFARNKFEKLERFLDGFAWLTIGIILPVLVQKPFKTWYTGRLQKQFPCKNPELLATSLKDLERSAWATTEGKRALAEKLGLEARHIEQHLPALVNKIIKARLAMLTIDLALMASKGVLFFWGRNALTEHLSHKPGFSGEFNVATQEQLATNTQDYQENKAKNKRLTATIAVFSVISLPLILLGLLKSPAEAGKGVIGKLKKLLPAFDAYKAVYVSKWVIFWDSFFNWNLGGFLAARSANEKREQVVRSVVFDSLCFVGDAILAGFAGKCFQNSAKYREKLQGLQLYKRGLLGIPVERKLEEVLADARSKGLSSEALQITEKLGRWNFRIGILSTSLLLGIGMTQINNWYTNKKLLAQKRVLMEKNNHLYQTPMLRKPAFNAFVSGVRPSAQSALQTSGF
ncbi:MAG TPA: hypothetical protein V6C52_03525 [Coleofasciculaceae cyanobacterium]|jgi:hypothetical protein